MNQLTILDVVAGVAVAGVAGLSGWVLAIQGRVSTIEKTAEYLAKLLDETRGRQNRQEKLCTDHQVERGILDERVTTIINTQGELKRSQEKIQEDVQAIREYLIQGDSQEHTMQIPWDQR